MQQHVCDIFCHYRLEWQGGRLRGEKAADVIKKSTAFAGRDHIGRSLVVPLNTGLFKQG
ncbi:protein of unknown function [Denitratisoma oestradiolicum]|uniref:Uncharacterized protein n=1 Tax=Denitratisoma oestradiolicum TaxID=311182 RepID=A0A6S6Y643_9PROT|nr:protein of unknown function [Denitratisoma oestradiolicum]